MVKDFEYTKFWTDYLIFLDIVYVSRGLWVKKRNRQRNSQC